MPPDDITRIYERLGGIEANVANIRSSLDEIKPKLTKACDASINHEARISQLEQEADGKATRSWGVILAVIVVVINMAAAWILSQVGQTGR